MKEKILVVDDDPQIRALLEKFLIKKGYEAATAASGEEAIDKVKTESPQVVLLDIKMPGADGITILKQFRQINDRLGVIMITGLKDEETARKAMAAGAYDYIVKPFDLNYLEMALLTKLALLNP